MFQAQNLNILETQLNDKRTQTTTCHTRRNRLIVAAFTCIIFAALAGISHIISNIATYSPPCFLISALDLQFCYNKTLIFGNISVSATSFSELKLWLNSCIDSCDIQGFEATQNEGCWYFLDSNMYSICVNHNFEFSSVTISGRSYNYDACKLLLSLIQ